MGVQKIGEMLFCEGGLTSKEKAKKFVRVVPDDVFRQLEFQARFVIRMMSKDYGPSDDAALKHMNDYMRRYEDINPIVNVDTYGVSLLLSYLIKDPKKAMRAKRYYRSLLDAWLKTRVDRQEVY